MSMSPYDVMSCYSILWYSLKQSAAWEHLTAHSMSSLPAATAACSVQSEEEARLARVLFS